jgi:hypothetical protein
MADLAAVCGLLCAFDAAAEGAAFVRLFDGFL